MGWLEQLKSRIGSIASPVVRSVTQSTPVRLAGRALGSSYVRPMIGFKPEIGGIIASELLPKDNPAKKVLDSALYLASGPLNITLGLGGSTPQGDTSTSNWRALGYSSEQDMKNRIAAQMQKDAEARTRAVALQNRPPNVYIADDYGPPRPVRYQDGGLMIGEYAVTRFDTPAQREVESTQPDRGGVTAPAARRPVEERRAPVTSPVTPEVTQPSQQRERQVGNELAQLYAKQYQLGREMEQSGELQRRLWEGGAAQGMTFENLMSWAERHPDLAYRLAEKRGLLPEPV